MKTLVFRNTCKKCKKYHKRGKECKYCYKNPVTTLRVLDCKDIHNEYWFSSSQPTSCVPQCIQGYSKRNPYIGYCNTGLKPYYC